MTTDEWAAGYARRKRFDPQPFMRYTGDHDALVAWMDKHGVQYSGMCTIDGTRHGEAVKERWYANGQQFDLERGQTVMLDGFRIRVYDPDQMERFFDIAQGPE